MKRLLRLQLRNVFRSKLFYICLGLTLLGPIVESFLTKEAHQVFPSMVDFLSTEISFIGTIFIALFCCFDFNEGTTKNIIARGYTKTQLLLSKYIVSIIGLLTMYLGVFLLYAFLFFENGFGFQTNLLYSFINSIIGIIANVVFYGTISFLLEKNGAAIIACLFIPNLIPTALTLIDSKLKLNIGDYWMEAASSKFALNPTVGNLAISIIYYLIYIGIFTFVGIKVLKRKEIK